MIIELNDIHFGYGKGFPKVLNGINCSFEKGGFYVLSGANGSGKTTLGKIIMGLLKPDKGSVSIDGEIVKKKAVARMAKNVGYTFQNPALQLFAPTVFEELSFIHEIKGEMNDEIKDKIENTLKELGLWEAKDRFPLTMSYGEMQRLAIATQIMRDVSFLLLDEPSSSLDSSGRQFLAKYLKEYRAKGGGIIMISHDDEMINLISEYTELEITKDGKLVE